MIPLRATETLEGMARAARLRAILHAEYELTGRSADAIRRRVVLMALARAMRQGPWLASSAAFRVAVRAEIEAGGGGAVVRRGLKFYVGIRPRVRTPDPKPGTAAFEKLRQQWYERADPHGEDLEDPRDPDAPLSMRGSLVTQAPSSAGHMPTLEQVRDRAEFTAAAEAFLASHRFRDARERRIWQGVCRAEASRDLALELRMRKAGVLKIIRRLKETMRLRLGDRVR